MPSQKQKPKEPLAPLDEPTVTTAIAPQTEAGAGDVVPTTPPTTTVPPLNHEQRRRLRNKLKQKYHS